LWTRAAEAYDEYLPQVTVKNGKASIRKQQPYLVPGLHVRDFVAVIDTRPGHERDALQRLAEAPNGAVLTRDALWIKNRRQTRSFPLNDFPDMTVDSAAIAGLKDDYFGLVMKFLWAGAICYSLCAKCAQAFLFALVPFFVTRAAPSPPGYGPMLKIAVCALAPPTMLDVLLEMFGIAASLTFSVYFLVYGAIIVLLSKDLRIRDNDRGDSLPESTT
jgi:hypothetical protein